MASHRSSSHRRTGLQALITAVAVALAGLVAVSGPANADETIVTPTVAQPSSSDQAKLAWIEAARGAEQLNESVLLAQQNVTAQQANAAAAQVAADATLADIATADAQVAAADAAVGVFQPKLDAFANASLKGARLSSLSSLLTADSADDYLDQVTALDQVAGDTLDTMSAAKDAKAVADAAKAAAEAVRLTAQQAADAAAAAVITAQQAADDLVAQQAALQASIATFEELYTSLSLSERGAALEDFENSNLSPEAQARLAEQADQRAAAGITDADIEVNVTELSVKLAPDTAAGIAVAAALTRRGLPYVWGATGPDSFDCSGLMLWAWAQAGVSIPRTSSEQSTLPEVPLDQLQPGDLVTFYSPVSHVGMYIGNGLVLHASMPGVPIKVVPLDKAGPDATGHHVPR